jgi:predicted secreted hydrolase
VLTEWWYYTGHLQATTAERFGFEFVVFQVQRFGYPVVYAAHAAVTVVEEQAFHWDERLVSVPQRQANWPLQLRVGDWALTSDGQSDRITAHSSSFAFTLDLRSTRPPVLHHGGYFEWAPDTGSYYYSRTRLTVAGRLEVDSRSLAVTGLAWNDHQWGNFLLGSGGWDWFALQLDDGTDIMLWQSRDRAQRVIERRGTVVFPDGTAHPLEAADIQIRVTGTWTSPHSGTTYPSGWEIALPPLDLTATVTPLVRDQELQALRSTGVVYWEGAVAIQAQRAGTRIGGQGYVELTGYAAPFARAQPSFERVAP